MKLPPEIASLPAHDPVRRLYRHATKMIERIEARIEERAAPPKPVKAKRVKARLAPGAPKKGRAKVASFAPVKSSGLARCSLCDLPLASHYGSISNCRSNTLVSAFAPRDDDGERSGDWIGIPLESPAGQAV